MTSQKPISSTEHINLSDPSYYFALENIKFGSTSLESDKYLLVCERGHQEVAFIDLATKAIYRQKMTAEAAILNPLFKIIALTAGQVVQIFDLQLRRKICIYTMPAPLVYWRWISSSTVALVTDTAVFHWLIDKDNRSGSGSAPVKIFDRSPQLATNHQIISYQFSQDEKWCLLCGISAGNSPGVINGTMQLYSVTKKLSQIIIGHSGIFTELYIPGRVDTAQVIIFEDNKPNQPSKLVIMELDKNASGERFRPESYEIPIASSDAINDFPALMHTTESGIVYVITKLGYLILFDIYSGKPLYRTRISTDAIFASKKHPDQRDCIICINRKGQVLLVTLDRPGLISHVEANLRDSSLALDINRRLREEEWDNAFDGSGGNGGSSKEWDAFKDDDHRDTAVEESEKLCCAAQLESFLDKGDIVGAVKIVVESPRGFLRNLDTISRFQNLPMVPGQPSPLSQYFSLLLDKTDGRLNRLESVELAKNLIFQQDRKPLLLKLWSEQKLEPSAELGDLMKSVDIKLAMEVYLKAKQAGDDACDQALICATQEQGLVKDLIHHLMECNDLTLWKHVLLPKDGSGSSAFKQALLNELTQSTLLEQHDGLETKSISQWRQAIIQVLQVYVDHEHEGQFLKRFLLQSLLSSSPSSKPHLTSTANMNCCEQSNVAPTAATFFQMGLQFDQMNVLDSALTAYSQCLAHSPSIWPQRAEVFTKRAELYFKLSRYVEGIADCEEALALNPSLLKLRIKQGKSNILLGDLDKARVNFCDLLQLDVQVLQNQLSSKGNEKAIPSKYELDALLYDTQVSARTYLIQIDKLRELLRTFRDAEKRLISDVSYRNYEAVLKAAEDVISSGCSEFQTARLSKAQVLVGMKRYAEAKSFIESIQTVGSPGKAMDISSGGKSESIMVKMLMTMGPEMAKSYWIAWTCSVLFDSSVSRSSSSSSSSTYPEDYQIMLQQCLRIANDLLFQLSSDAKSWRWLKEEAVRLQAYFDCILSTDILSTDGKYDTIVEQCTKLLQQYDPQANQRWSVPILGQRAMAWLQKNQHNDVVRDCHMVLQLDPLYALAYLYRARAYRGLNKVANSEYDYNTYLSSYPMPKDFLAVNEELDSLLLEQERGTDKEKSTLEPPPAQKKVHSFALTEKDPFTILGVDRDASVKAIETAFRKLALQYHPDKNKTNPKAEEFFKLLNSAKEKLLADRRKDNR